MKLLFLLIPAIAASDVIRIVGDGIVITHGKMEFAGEHSRSPRVPFKISNRTGQKWNRVILTAEASLDCDLAMLTIWLHLADISPSSTPFTVTGAGPVLNQHPGPCAIRSMRYAVIAAEGTDRTYGLYSNIKDGTEREKLLKAFEQESRLAQEHAIEAALDHASALKEHEGSVQKEKARLEAELGERLLLMKRQCLALYRATVDRKIADLTVGEDQAIRACQKRDMYPPLN